MIFRERYVLGWTAPYIDFIGKDDGTEYWDWDYLLMDKDGRALRYLGGLSLTKNHNKALWRLHSINRPKDSVDWYEYDCFYTKLLEERSYTAWDNPLWMYGGQDLSFVEEARMEVEGVASLLLALIPYEYDFEKDTKWTKKT